MLPTIVSQSGSTIFGKCRIWNLGHTKRYGIDECHPGAIIKREWGDRAEVRPKRNGFDLRANGESRKPNIDDRKERNLPEAVAICECLLIDGKAAGTETSAKFGHHRNARRQTTRTDGREILTRFNAPASAMFPTGVTESGATYDAPVRERG
jgi:hypothetical protein